MTTLEPGTRVERYEILRILGQGGMATVALARHVELGSEHALKLLFLQNPGVAQRMLQEGRVQATIDHHNVVGVRDVIRVQGLPCLVMEYVDGPSLNGLLYAFTLSQAQIHDIAMQLFDGMQAAHGAGLVHRDLKPHNVMLALSGNRPTVKIADFGLAKVRASQGESLGNFRTRTGQMMGTPAYMAPEQFNDAKHVDARADIFSIGCMLYELLSGAPPFGTDRLVEIYSRAAAGQYTPLDATLPHTPRSFVSAIAAALQPDAKDRPASIDALRAIWEEDAPDVQDAWQPQDLTAMAVVRDQEHAASAHSAQQRAEDAQGGADPTLPAPMSTHEPTTPKLRGLWVSLAAVGLGVVVVTTAAVFGAVAWQSGRFDVTSQAASPSSQIVPASLDTPSPAPPADVTASVQPDREPPGVEPEPAVTQPLPTTAPEPPMAAPAPPTPTTEAPIIPAPQPAIPLDSASFSVRGGVDAYLVDVLGRAHYPGSRVEPGNYQLWAVFDAQNPTRVMTLTLAAGDARTITCSGAQRVCR